jgi:hypothetical protein
MRVRRLPPARRTCRPRVWGPAPCARRPAMANGDALDQACGPIRWSPRAQGPWPPRVLPDRPSSTSTVVSSWPPTHATPPHGRPPQLLEGDKGQTPVERGCRFLKDPALLASALDRKTPERIMALVMVMTVCWLGYAALEYRIRQALQGHDATFPNPQGKRVQHPTTRWVCHDFVGIHLLMAPGPWPIVLHLTDAHRHLLPLLGKPSRALYGVNYS